MSRNNNHDWGTMLVFNLFGRKDTECIRFERYFLSMGNCLEDFWSIMRKDMNGFSREEEEAFIGEYKHERLFIKIRKENQFKWRMGF